MRKITSSVCISLVAAFVLSSLQAQQKISSIDLDRCKQMLRDVHDALKKHYYDVNYHGIDMDARFSEFEDKMKRVESIGQGFTVVAAYLEPLNDSHTFFLPPQRTMRFDYGYRMQIVGDSAFVTDVRPNTDAAKVLTPGDQVLKVFSYDVNRRDLWKLQYFLNSLYPRPAISLSLRSPEGQDRQVVVNAKVKQLKRVLDLTGSSSDMDIWQLVREMESEDHLLRQRYVESGDLIIWKMPEFDMSTDGVDHMFGIARKHGALILDLRGNPGGSVSTLVDVVGDLFDREVKIADRVGRKEMKPTVAKSRGKSAYSGKLVVLLDSRSASAAELLARVVQIEKRGAVIGDRSSGSVMESRIYPFSQGADNKIFYNMAITDADLIMTDGKSLEHSGVVPDQIVLPTADDLAKSRDPVLAHAAKSLGFNLSPEAAGKMFPIEWSPE